MFHGSLVAIVTPMKADGSLDLKSLAGLIDWHIENDTNAIVVLGTTGESPTINATEREQIVRYTIRHVADRIPVIVGTGANDTRVAVAMAQQAMELGADACLVVTPYYNKPTQEGLFQHFAAVAEAASIPLILYNVPSRTGCDLLPATVERLAKFTNIIGLKEATASIDRMRTILQCCGDSLDLFSGDDASCMDFMLAGGKGVISVAANVVPKAMHDLSVAATEGNREQAKVINAQLQPLYKMLTIESNPIPVKWAVHEMGLIDVGIRLPLTPLMQEFRQSLNVVLKQLGILRGIKNEMAN